MGSRKRERSARGGQNGPDRKGRKAESTQSATHVYLNYGLSEVIIALSGANYEGHTVSG